MLIVSILILVALVLILIVLIGLYLQLRPTSIIDATDTIEATDTVDIPVEPMVVTEPHTPLESMPLYSSDELVEITAKERMLRNHLGKGGTFASSIGYHNKV